MMTPKLGVLVAAAGQSLRMGTELNKQFLPLGGRPVLAWSLEFFERHPAVDAIVVVCREDELEYCRREVLEPGGYRKVTALVAGGDQRQDSVWAGLQALPPATGWVAVHDGARPLLSAAVFDALIKAAAEQGAAIPGLRPPDTLKTVDAREQVRQTLDREEVRAIQTPQLFPYKELCAAYQQARADGVTVTDDAALYERYIGPVTVTEGDPRALKLTRPEDLRCLESLLPEAEAIFAFRPYGMVRELPAGPLRVGQGYDVHRLVANRRLVLGGVDIPYEKGLLGHSDADVLTHAICDALLGAAALGDLGRHFPDSSAEFKDIDSQLLLQRVKAMLDGQGYTIHNIDSTVVAQSPKLAPYIERMRARIAATLEIKPEQVGIKATTTEGLGFEGRGEGISAQAVVLLAKAGPADKVKL